MHRFYQNFVLFLFLASGHQLIGQSTLLTPVTTVVDKSKAGNKLPAIIDNSVIPEELVLIAKIYLLPPERGGTLFIIGKLPNLTQIQKQ